MFSDFLATITEQVEFTPEQNGQLAEFLKGAVEKRDRLADFIHRLESEAEFLRAKEKRLADMRHSIEGLIGMFTGSIKAQLENMGVKSVSGLESRFTVKRNPASLAIVNEKEIPAKFINYEPVVDKNAVKEALQAGEVVPGAELVTDRSHLEIR